MASLQSDLIPGETVVVNEMANIAVINTKPTYSSLRSNIIRFTPESMQCKLYCRGTACKYCDASSWPNQDQAIYGLYSSWITPEILAMARPTSLAMQQFEIIRQFKREKIKTVINLQGLNEHAFCGPPLLPSGFSYDPETLMKNKIYYYNFAIPDFGITNVYFFLDIIKVMWFALKQGKIAVHCHAGLGRTCTLIACYLVWSKGITAEEAIKMVRTKRSKSIQSPKQILLVEQLATLMEKYAGVLPHEKGLTLTNYLMMQNDFIPSEETRKFSHIPKVVFYVCDRLLNLVFQGQFKYILSESENLQHNVRECTFGKIVVEWKHAYTSKGFDLQLRISFEGLFSRAQIRYMVNILARISAFPFEQDENTKLQFKNGITVVNIDKMVTTMDASCLVYLLNHYMKSIKRPYGEKQHLISVFEKFAMEEKSKKLPNNLEKSEPAKLNHTWQCLIFYLLNVLSYLTGENYEVCSSVIATWIYGNHCPELKATIYNYMRDLFARNLIEQEQQSKDKFTQKSETK